MDKQKVIAAYRRGFLTQQECAQILGLDSLQLMKIMQEAECANTSWPALSGRAAQS